MEPQEHPLRIISLQIENTKKVKAIRIEPGGAPLVRVKGPNDQGKSTVLDSIVWALGGKGTMDAAPIRRGTTESRIAVEVGDYTVTRKTTAAGSYLDVRHKTTGAVASPQKFLDAAGAEDFSFRVEDFLRAKPDVQREAAIRAIGLEAELADLTARAGVVFNERTGTNRDLRALEARVSTMPVVDAPDEPVSAADLIAQLNASGRADMDRRTHADLAAAARRRAADCGRELEQIQKDIARLQARAKEIAAAASGHLAAATAAEEKAAAIPAPANTDAIAAQIRDVDATNAKVRAKKERAAYLADLDAKKHQAEEQTAQLAGLEAEKSALITGAEFPVAGLGFSTDGLTLDGLPLNQAARSKQLRVAIALRMLKNPRLRIVPFYDGSLLDAESKSTLQELAREHDFQVWIEEVADSGEGAGFFLIDGEIASIDGIAQPGWEPSPASIAGLSLEFADALIAALDKPAGKEAN